MSNGARLLPPPDRDWARTSLLATKPEYAGRAGILLFNLQKGSSDLAAYHNAFNKTKAVKSNPRWTPSGQPNSSPRPMRSNRPINAQRDFDVHQLDPDVADLEIADLLTPQSEAIYKRLYCQEHEAGRLLRSASP